MQTAPETQPQEGADRRIASRHPVDYTCLFERPRGGEFHARIVNISASGFMLEELLGLGKGGRVAVRLPVVGAIEAFEVWAANGRSGFKFERLIRDDDFADMLEKME